MTFSKAIPSARLTELRNTWEHFDDYAIGKGRLQLEGVSVDIDAWNEAARKLGGELIAATLPIVLAQQEVEAPRS